MIVEDFIYGNYDVREKVLLDVMESRPLQRLKGIAQAGASKYVLPHRCSNRYEHSVGVMLLLRHLGATVEEQLAGLMHDIPHTAFSHVVDYVFENEEQDFHEHFHERIVMGSEIPSLLKAHGISVDYVLDESNFPLLERKIPDLCADRVDYALRDGASGLGYVERSRTLFNGLAVHDNEIVFTGGSGALDFARYFLQSDYEMWASPAEVGIFHIMAKAIKRGLDESVISEDDLFLDDSGLYSKLKNSGSAEVERWLGLLTPNLNIVEADDGCDFRSSAKVRYVDPKFIEGGEILRASEAYPRLKEEIRRHNEKISRGFCLKIKRE